MVSSCFFRRIILTHSPEALRNPQKAEVILTHKKKTTPTQDRKNVLAHIKKWWKKPFFVHPVKTSGQEEEKGYLCHRVAS